MDERIYTRLALKVETQDLVQFARAFPQAVIGIGEWTGRTGPDVRYSARDIRAFRGAIAELQEAGARRIVVGARWDLLTDEFVDAMVSARTQVDVWNSTTVRSPQDPALEARRLRERYGDALGVIDLRAAPVDTRS